MTTVAKRYDVSSNYLARICRRLGVPHPERGYWAKHAVGIELTKPPMPDAAPGADLEWLRDGGTPRRQPLSGLASTPTRRKRGEKRPDQHRLLIGARAHFDHAREHDGEYVRPWKHNLIDVCVSNQRLEQGLKIASELYLALEERGQRVVLASASAHYRHKDVSTREDQQKDQDYGLFSSTRWSPGVPTISLVGEVAIGITLFEISEEVEAQYDSTLRRYVRVEPAVTLLTRSRRVIPAQTVWTSKRWMASGRFGVHAFAPYRDVEWEKYWYEKEPSTLAKMFGAIANELERAAPTISKLVDEATVREEEQKREAEVRRAKWEKEYAEAERKRAEAREIERRREEEAKRETALRDSMSRWRLARDIREHVDDIKRLVHDAGLEITKDSKTDEELTWALAYADRVDPLTSWRRDIAEVKRQPCPTCGKIHGVDPEPR
jgi:hypothetical protein